MFKTVRFSEKRLQNAQDGVLERYKKRFRLTKKEASALHSFFSPYRVPKGLTKVEAKLAIKLYPLLGSYRGSAIGAAERFLKLDPDKFSSRVVGTPLPEEFTAGGRITRTKFRNGVIILLQRLT